MRAVIVVALLAAASPASSQPDPLHRPYDELLDLYVRDGFVYYNALKADRSRLDRYLASLNSPAALAQANGSPAEQHAFWINAYNALVLKTVIDHFPIRGKAPGYPTGSIRQIPGAFERQPHRVGGRTLTLDAIEKEVLVPLGDARSLLALGRGAVGGGRLRSEAYVPGRLEAQLTGVAAESLQRGVIVRVDAAGRQLVVSPLFSWRESAFTASFADRAPAAFAARSPLERAVLGLIGPHVLSTEAAFLDQNTFRMVFGEFDWRLNDLSSRP